MYQDINASLDIPVFLSPPMEARTTFLFEPAKTWNIFFPFFLFFRIDEMYLFLRGIPGRWKYPAYARSSSMIDVLIPRGNVECLCNGTGKESGFLSGAGVGAGWRRTGGLRGKKKNSFPRITHV
jgi:hypothetical protein